MKSHERWADSFNCLRELITYIIIIIIIIQNKSITMRRIAERRGNSGFCFTVQIETKVLSITREEYNKAC